jgi:hypothetical protein
VKSENNAGLISDVHTSDGLLVLDQNVNVNELGTQGFKIYPNPANDYIHFKFPSHFSSLLIEIYSIKSELIRRVELKSGEAVFVGDLSSGMYIIKLEGKAYLIQLN